MSNKPTVVVAMSGGVGLVRRRRLLLRQGYNVLGVTMQIWQESTTQTKGAGCCSLGAVEDARRVAGKLGIPHYVLNFREFFAEKVIDNFVAEYKRGRTPNPCVNCNRYVKFDALLSKARSLGAEYLATGHYARGGGSTRTGGAGRCGGALDGDKDQTYALYHFTQEELAHTLMPLGLVTNKAETRAIASELGLVVAGQAGLAGNLLCAGRLVHGFSGADGPGDGAGRGHRGHRRGAARAARRDRVLHHRAAQAGQRRLPIPLYVVDIDAATNTVVVGGNDDLMASGLVADDINWVGIGGLQDSLTVTAKIRYNMEAVPATVQIGARDGEIIVHFDVPQRAVTPGQSLVLYDSDAVLGGATIQRRV